VNNNIVAIYDVDTRALVQHIRTKGAMNCIVTTETDELSVLQEQLRAVPDMGGLELSSVVSTKEAYTVGDPDAPIRIAVLDLGVKRNILSCLADRNAFLKVFPAKADPAEMRAFDPHGYFVSNGPGDPAAMDYAVNTMQQL